MHVCTEGMSILVYTHMQCMDVPRCTVMGFNKVCPHGLGETQKRTRENESVQASARDVGKEERTPYSLDMQ